MPQQTTIEVPVEKVVERAVTVHVKDIYEVPVETLVEKIVRVPQETIIEVPVERIVEKSTHISLWHFHLFPLSQPPLLSLIVR